MLRVPSHSLEYPGHDGLYYLNDQPFTGIAYSTRRDETIRCEIEYRDGVPWGSHREYHPGGSLKMEGVYVAGFQEGTWKSWHADGQLAQEMGLEFGCTLWRNTWDETGNQTEQYVMQETDSQFRTLQMYREAYGKAGYLEE